jgi:hypothetical protein
MHIPRRAAAVGAAVLTGLASLGVAGAEFASPAAPAAARTQGLHSGGAGQEHFTVTPKATNNLDCNGWSPRYKSVALAHRALCTDPRGSEYGNGRGRFIDNGHYVGHDEPSVKFISNVAGSSNTMTYFMTLPKDPPAAATNTGSVTNYAELSPAPWFGLPICDPASYPQNPCTPDSDSNSGSFTDPNAAGSAFMELQFYPPGLAPFADSVSCDKTQWCAALTVTSYEVQFEFAGFNPNCFEPQNFAFLQRNGVPAGPPSPQLADISTFTPSAQTLVMNSGDVLKVQISDPGGGTGPGLTTVVTDLTTGQSGFMVASAANGFMNTSIQTCQGSPFTFHAEYSSAKIQNQVPWTSLDSGVVMEQEIGHGEVCRSLASKDRVAFSGFSDKTVFDTCIGGPGEGSNRGEGSCNPKTGKCVNPTTQGTDGPVACPSKSFVSGYLCEYADGVCLPHGTRTVSLLGQAVTETSPVNFCGQNRFQNGDLDFDGLSYQNSSWPNGTPNTPASTRYVGPFMANGQPYPTIQFESNAPNSESLCNFDTLAGCEVPPQGANFYPYFTMTNKQPLGSPVSLPAGACVWNFGNTIQGITTADFGQDAQYGAVNVDKPGNSISAPTANPEFNGSCPAFSQP